MLGVEYRRFRARMPVLLFLGLVFAASALGAQESVASLKERIIDVQNASPLGFRRLELSSEAPSYGRYAPIPSSEVLESSAVFLYIEPDNLYTIRDGGRYYVEFVQDLMLVDTTGSILIDAPDLVEFFYESVSPLLDIYAENRINLEGLPPGEYRFIVTLHDLLGGDSVQGEIAITVIPQ